MENDRREQSILGKRSIMKILLKVVGGILLLVAVGLMGFSVYLNSTIKEGVENLGSRITGTEVTVDMVDLSLLTGEGQLKNLVVGNPPGFRTEHAFYLGEINIEFDLRSLWSDTIRIEEILIDSPEILYESTKSGSNIGKIHESVKAFAGPPKESGEKKSEQDGKPQEEPSKQTKILIDEFMVKDAHLSVVTPLSEESLVTVILPVLHLENIGTQVGGANLREISSLIYSETQKAIEQEISKRGIPLGSDLKKLNKKLDGVLKKASKFLEGFNNLLGK